MRKQKGDREEERERENEWSIRLFTLQMVILSKAG